MSQSLFLIQVTGLKLYTQVMFQGSPTGFQ
jgi:hypothetical protein